MLRSLYKNLRISSFVQCCYENYSAMQSNKRFNYSLVVPLLLLMWRVVLQRPGRDNWGIWVEYSAALAAHLLFSLIFVCLISPEAEGSTVQRGGSSGWPWFEAHEDLANKEDNLLVVWQIHADSIQESAWETSEPLKKRSIFRFV